MKVNPDFMLRQIGDICLIVCLKDKTFHKVRMIATNESGAFLWQTLQNSCNKKELLSSLQSVYEVDEETALNDIDSFLASLKNIGALIE